MRRIFFILLAGMLSVGSVHAQTENKPFSFKYYMKLMNWGVKGQSLEAYRKHAKDMGLNLIYHEEDKSEIYYVWAQDVEYSKGHMTETYTKTGNTPRCLNMDLTISSGREKFVPITTTIIFPTKEQWLQFKQDGLRYGCLVNNLIEDTDVDVTWTNVSGIMYSLYPGKVKSWHFIYFYEKDGMYMCTFLF